MKTMNYLLKITMAVSLLACIAMGCSDDESPQVGPDKPQPDGEALKQSHSDFLAGATDHFVMDAEEGGSMEGSKGTVLTIHANTLVDSQGNDVTGEVDIELVEILDKSSMLLSDKTTQGRQEDGSIAMLVSGGEFFVNAKQGGEQLELKPGIGFMLMVPVDETDQEMQIFTNEDGECMDQDCDVVWEEDRDGGIEIVATPDGSPAYYAFASSFGWTNIDKWYSDPRPKTTIFVDVPEGYDETNCAVYLSYDGEPTALAGFDVYNSGTGLFTEHYGLIPIGLEVHFIIVSIVDGDYNYAIQGATIEEDHVEVMGDLSPTTEAELIQLIEDLP